MQNSKSIIKTLAKVLLVGGVLVPSASFAYPITSVDGELTIWMPSDKAVHGMQYIAKKFSKEQHVNVKVLTFQQIERDFKDYSLKGEGPDIFMWAHDKYGEWISLGLLEPIEFRRASANKFHSFALDAMKFGDKYYGYPVAIETVSLLCNDKLVSKTPTSFEDFVELDKQFKALQSPVRALAWNYLNMYYTYPLISANGGYVYKKTDKGFDINDIGINNEGSKIGFNHLRTIIKNNNIPKVADYYTVKHLFKTNKVACIIDGPWSWKEYDDAKIKYTVNVLPTLNGKRSKPFVGVSGLVINSHSTNKQLAKKFIEEYVLTNSGMQELNDDVALGGIALKSYQKILQTDPIMGFRTTITMQNAMNGDLMPSVPEMMNFWKFFAAYMKKISLGKIPVDDALLQAEKEMKKN